MPTPSNQNGRGTARLTFANGRPAGVRERAAMHQAHDKTLRLYDLQIRGQQFARALAEYLADFEDEALFFLAAGADTSRVVGQVRRRIELLAEFERMAAKHGIPNGVPLGDDRG